MASGMVEEGVEGDGDVAVTWIFADTAGGEGEGEGGGCLGEGGR